MEIKIEVPGTPKEEKEGIELNIEGLEPGKTKDSEIDPEKMEPIKEKIPVDLESPENPKSS